MNDTTNTTAGQPAIKLTNSALTLDQVTAFLAGDITAAELPAPQHKGPLMETVFARTYSRPMRVTCRHAAMQAAA